MNKSILKGSAALLFLSAALYSCKSSQEVTTIKEQATGINVNYI